MSITPLDVQVNMAHIHDVAKSTHAKNEALIQQHLFMDHESEEESNRQKDRVQHNNESDETRMEPDAKEQGKQGSAQKHREDKESVESTENTEQYKDPNLGQTVDYTR